MSLWCRNVLITNFTHNLLCTWPKNVMFWNYPEVLNRSVSITVRQKMNSKSIMTLNMHGSIYIFRDTITYNTYLMHTHVHLQGQAYSQITHPYMHTHYCNRSIMKLQTHCILERIQQRAMQCTSESQTFLVHLTVFSHLHNLYSIKYQDDCELWTRKVATGLKSWWILHYYRKRILQDSKNDTIRLVLLGLWILSIILAFWIKHCVLKTHCFHSQVKSRNFWLTGAVT